MIVRLFVLFTVHFLMAVNVYFFYSSLTAAMCASFSLDGAGGIPGMERGWITGVVLILQSGVVHVEKLVKYVVTDI